jgi:outer membrane protein
MTRKIASTIFLGLACTAGAFAQAAPAANATVAPPTKVGTIAIQAAIINTNEGLRDLGALDKKFEPKQTELEGSRKELETLTTQLQQQGAKLNDDEAAKRRQTIEGKQKVYQRNLEDAQNEFQQQQAEIGNRIGQKLLEVLDKYARANNFAVVIDIGSQNTPVLWRSETVDITRAVIDAYNQQSGVPAPPQTPGAPSATRPGGSAGSVSGGTPARPAGTGTAPRKPAGTATTPK